MKKFLPAALAALMLICLIGCNPITAHNPEEIVAGDLADSGATYPINDKTEAMNAFNTFLRSSNNMMKNINSSKINPELSSAYSTVLTGLPFLEYWHNPTIETSSRVISAELKGFNVKVIDESITNDASQALMNIDILGVEASFGANSQSMMDLKKKKYSGKASIAAAAKLSANPKTYTHQYIKDMKIDASLKGNIEFSGNDQEKAPSLGLDLSNSYYIGFSYINPDTRKGGKIIIHAEGSVDTEPVSMDDLIQDDFLSNYSVIITVFDDNNKQTLKEELTKEEKLSWSLNIFSSLKRRLPF